MRQTLAFSVLLAAGTVAMCQSVVIPGTPTDRSPLFPGYDFRDGKPAQSAAQSPFEFRGCGGLMKSQNQGSAPDLKRDPFAVPCTDPKPAPFLLTMNSLPAAQTLVEPWPQLKREPIPTEWPKARVERIPTEWPDLKFSPLGQSTRDAVPTSRK